MNKIEQELNRSAPTAKPEARMAAIRCVEDPDHLGLGRWLARFGMTNYVSDSDFKKLSSAVDRLRAANKTADVGPGTKIQQ